MVLTVDEIRHVTDEEREAAERLEAADTSPAAWEEYNALCQAWRDAVGPEKLALRDALTAKKAFSNETTGPWCDDDYQWHGHPKSDTSSHWYQVCKACHS